MSLLITPELLELNRQKHTLGSYGLSGYRWAIQVNELACGIEARTVLDYGCGQGTLGAELRKFNPTYEILEYDPAIPGKEEKPLRADVVVCSDVLEHIEPECLYAVLDDIRNIARLAVFLVVHTGAAAKHFSDGRNTHLIIEPSEWWLPKILDRWKLERFRELGNSFMCVCTGYR